MNQDTTVHTEAPHRISWYDALILFPLFVMVATHMGFAGLVNSAGPSTLLRSSSAMLLFAAVALKYPWQGLPDRIPFILAVCVYYLLLNLSNLTPFAVMSTVFIAVGLVTGNCLSRFQPNLLDALFKYYIAFNVLGLTIAFALLLGTGEIADVHQLVFPFSRSRAEEYLGFARLSGFQVEPGTYSNVIFIFVLMRAVLRGRLYSRLDLVAMLSTLATLAAWALIGVGAYMVALCLEALLSKRPGMAQRRLLYVGLILALIAMIVPFAGTIADSELATYFATRYQGGDSSGSTQLKIDAFNAWMAYLGLQMLLGTALPNTYCLHCDSLQDFGVLPNMAFYLGLVPTAALIAMLSVRLWRISIAVLVFSLPVAVSKFFFYDPLVWMLVGVVMGSAYGDSRSGHPSEADAGPQERDLSAGHKTQRQPLGSHPQAQTS